MNGSKHLGLDLGGSAIKGVVLQGGRQIHTRVVPTRREDAPAGIVAQLAEFGNELAAHVGGVDTAGITVPGTFDLTTGVAHFITNLGGDSWKGVTVRDPVEAALGVPTSLINDARAFGFAESRLGAARACNTAAFFTLGTGVGGAVVVDRKLVLGYGSAGELGHVTVDADPAAPVCACGNRGCVEVHVQAAAIALAGGRETAEEVIDAARAGDATALGALERAGRWLGIAISIIGIAINPERVVIGGGVAEAGDLILDPARDEVHRRLRMPPTGRVEIVRTALGYEAGSIGAALWGAEHA